jgi:hypothetical protein
MSAAMVRIWRLAVTVLASLLLLLLFGDGGDGEEGSFQSSSAAASSWRPRLLQPVRADLFVDPEYTFRIAFSLSDVRAHMTRNRS